MNLLELLLLANFISLVGLFLFKDVEVTKLVSLVGGFGQLFVVSLLWVFFDKDAPFTQFDIVYGLSSRLNLIYHLGVDGLSLFFIFLSVLLLPICILASWTTVIKRVRDFHVLLHLITFMLINVFCVQDVLLFYLFFESILIPMFLMIGVWGSRDRKIHAGYQFFLYTLAGSVLMLLAILYMYVLSGSTHWEVLYLQDYTVTDGRLLWLAFFLSFAVKVPMVPVHIWLPEAHVEAPTAGSVLLAGILLKMGTYGLIKFSLPFFQEACAYYQPLVFCISLVGIIYAACTTIRQIDLKKIIAYSSVGHMNYVTIGILSNNIQGLEGSIYMMIGHGLVSSALFLCVGLLYERYHTRSIMYYGSLVVGMPLFTIFFFFFTLANVSLPGTSNFIGEFLILLGAYRVNFFTTFVACIGVILGAVYAIWLFNRVCFGVLKTPFMGFFSDLNRKEFFSLLILCVMTLVTGLFPNLVLSYLHSSVLLVMGV